jgi:hypothetical protein
MSGKERVKDREAVRLEVISWDGVWAMLWSVVVLEGGEPSRERK